MTTLITNLSLYITFTMIYCIRLEYICQCFSSLLIPYMSPMYSMLEWRKYSRRLHTDPQKFKKKLSYKQVNGRNGDHE